jgi:UDP-N-acetylmuramoylalanine--D-glutamate ligase
MRALVHGLGRFGGGSEAIRFLHRRGWRLRVADRAPREQLEASAAALADLDDLEWRLGDEDPALLDGCDLLVLNPAVADSHALPLAARARGVPITQEATLFLEHFPGRVVLVTGTNGKSTTTTLLGRALRAAGIPALAGGNVGHSLLAEEPRWCAEQVAVLEISSFQLERIDPDRHRAAGAVITRVTRDHLDRHGTLAAYHAAKARAAAAAERFVVHAADDPVASAFATRAAQRVTFAGRPPAPGHVGMAGDWAVSALADPGPILHASALVLLGAYQLENVLAAFAAAALLGAPRAACGKALATASPLRYRLQLVLQRDGVRIYDNAVSTEVQSTLVALQALRGPIHWIGGGKSKDGDFAAVADAVAPRIASAHLFGTAAGPMHALLAGRVPATAHDALPDALDAAWSAARPGDALLFSPAFASFDQYPNFRARAERFHAWLARRRPAAAIGRAMPAG